MNLLRYLINNFKETFKITTDETIPIFFAPGRVNLIGEHIDYNGGKVFPCSINLGTYGVAKKNNSSTFRVYSMNFQNTKVIEFNISNLTYTSNDSWSNYPKGIIKNFIDKGFSIDCGLDILFYGNIPNGAGLSSSASIEILTCIILKSMFNLKIDMLDMVKLSQKTENDFIGVNCGIMDQFSIGMGKKNHAILLDCTTLKYEYIPLNLKNISIIIANSNKQRTLGDSKYNSRRESCESALQLLKNNNIKINSLCDMNVETFEKIKHLIPCDKTKNIVKHVVTENERVLKSVEYLKSNDILNFGKLMNSSHISLKNDYKVTGFELDTLVELALKQTGTIGSRMTGAGFGGCTVSLVENRYIDSFIHNIGEEYKKKTGLTPAFYIVTAGSGAKKLGDNR